MTPSTARRVRHAAKRAGARRPSGSPAAPSDGIEDSAAAAVVAAGAQDRQGAQRRHLADSRHRHRRPRDQGRHPRLHRRAGTAPAAQAARRRAAAARQPAPPPRRRRCAAGAAAGAARQRRRPGRCVPMSVMRRKIAEHMVLSRRTSAHVHSVFEVNFTRVAQIREAKKAEYEQAGAKLTYLSFIVKAVVDALRAVPGRQRVDRRRQHRLPQGHQPRHRRRARLGPDRAGDQERRREEPARPEPRDRRPGRRARAPSSSSRTKCPAARSPSPTRASSARCSACRSSTSRRSRFSASATSRSGRS